MKQKLIKRAVSQCPAIPMDLFGRDVPSLLNSGSMVTLIREVYFTKHIQPLLKKSSSKMAEAHSLFRLSAANKEIMLVSKYFEADVSILGFRIPRVGFLVVKDPNVLLKPQHNTQLPGVIGCNLIRLGCEEFKRSFGCEAFEEFRCPESVHPVVFSQLCSHYHQSKLLDGPSTPTSNSNIDVSTSAISAADDKVPCSDSDNILGQVWVGVENKSICIPANSVKVIQGKTNKITRRLTCMVEGRDICNLPMGVVVNRAMVTPKRFKKVSVILANTNSYNIWIRQPLLAADIVEVESCLWDYQTILSREDKNIKASFCCVPPPEVQEEVFSSAVMSKDSDTVDEKGTSGEKPKKFGPRPDFNSPNYDFDKELARLPFPLNLGKVDLSKDQQVRFLELIYNNQSILSLGDEDLGLCDRLKHTIPTTTDKPVYLPHRTIPVQLQAEVRKCLDTWLRQGIIRPSRSPYASQVVIVCKKPGEIRLCIDFRALNAITIRDSFPLPRIEEALQAVKAAVWFTSFDLAQGYLQLAMDEADIHKTAFRAGSSGLYEFTGMPFGLSNTGASFCCLMEMCLGDQQYLMLLFILTTSVFLAALSMRCLTE